MGEKILDISWGTIVKFAIGALVVYVLYLIQDLLVWIVFGIVLAIIFEPLIAFLQKYRVPRAVSTLGVYVIIFGIIAFTIFATTPFFLQEIQKFSRLLPQYFEESISPSLRGLGIATFEDFQSFVNAFSADTARLTSNIFSAFALVFGGIFSTVFVLSIAVFLSLEEKPIERALVLLFPKKHEATALNIWARTQRKVAGWFLSRVLTSIFVALATYLSLALFSVQYPFSLGLLSGLLNFIPIVGPLVAGIAIALVVALDNVMKAIFVILAFILIQQIEGNVLTPVLAKRFIGLPPVLVLISLVVGAQFWGIIGSILAIPLGGILYEFIRDFLKQKKEGSGVVL